MTGAQGELFGEVGGLFGPDLIPTTPLELLDLPRERTVAEVRAGIAERYEHHCTRPDLAPSLDLPTDGELFAPAAEPDVEAEHGPAAPSSDPREWPGGPPCGHVTGTRCGRCARPEDVARWVREQEEIDARDAARYAADYPNDPPDCARCPWSDRAPGVVCPGRGGLACSHKDEDPDHEPEPDNYPADERDDEPTYKDRRPARIAAAQARTYCGHAGGCGGEAEANGLCSFHNGGRPAVDLFDLAPSTLCDYGTPKAGEPRRCSELATHAARWVVYDGPRRDTNGLRCCRDHADYYASAWVPRYDAERGAAWIEAL
jgi:hypothetical protein